MHTGQYRTALKFAAGTLALVTAAQASAAGYSVSTSANTGRGYARGCAAQYNAGGSIGASLVVNDGSNANCIGGGGPGSTSFNNQNVTVTGSTDKTGKLTASHDESSNVSFDPIYGSAHASAAADLATGKVHLFATAEYSAGDAGAAISSARLNDTLHFSVAGANASTITLIPVSFAFDGKFTADRSLGPSATLYYDFTFGNASAYEFGDYGAGYYNGTSHPTFRFPASAGLTSGWQSASFSSYDPQNTRFSGIYALTGASADIPISFGLQIIAGNNVTLDYLNTGSISIGKVAGVFFTSDSGVFLTKAGGGVGGVPEPASWAMLIAGFGLVGTAARRRRDLPRVNA